MCIRDSGIFVFFLQYGFKTIRPIFRDRGKINADVTGRLTESLGGVRVIKGYHAEEREATVFAAGVERLLANVMRSLTMTSTLSAASTTVLGLVSAIVMWLGGHNVLGSTWTVGTYFQSVSYTHLDVYKRQEYRKKILPCNAPPIEAKRARSFQALLPTVGGLEFRARQRTGAGEARRL